MGAWTALFAAGAQAQEVETVTVAEIRFEGLSSVDESTARTAIRLTANLVISGGELKSVVADDIRRLYRLGHFDRVDAFYEDQGENRIAVVFRFEERRRIKEVTFEGRQKMARKAVAETVKVSAGERLSAARLNADVAALKQLYFDKGYRFADVSYRVDDVAGGVKVTYIIVEGPKAVVRGINIEGNAVLSDWYIINKVLKTKVDRFYNTKILDEQILEEDFGRIEEAYANRGYVRAKVLDHSIDYRNKRSAIFITIKVDEGKLYRTGNLAFAGNTKFPATRLEEEVEWPVGKPFPARKLQLGVDKVRSLYRNNGYLFVGIESAEDIDEVNGVVNATIRVAEGEPARVRLIEVAGNRGTQDKVIRREIRLRPGDIYKEDKLIRSIQRLHNLGYFDEVRPDFRIISREEGKVDLLIDVVEKANTAKVNFGAGYSTLDGLVGTFSLTWANFDAAHLPFIWRCRGGGQELRLNTEIGRRRTQYSFGFTEPYLWDTKTSGAFDFYKTRSIRTYYDDNRLGGNLTFGRPLTEYLSGRVGYNYEQVEVTSNMDDPSRIPPSVSSDLGRKNTSAGLVGIERDSRDNVFFPKGGSDSSIDFQVAGSVLGGDVEFWRTTLGTAWYFNYIWETVLAVRVRGGYVERYGRTHSIPIYERYYLGGAKTVRGYDEWEVGPKDRNGYPLGGKTMFYTNFEYRIPVSKEFFHFILFWDSGYCWEELKYLNLQDLESGVGGGIRVNIPMMGLLGIDYGYGLSAGTGQVHFNIGNTF